MTICLNIIESESLKVAKITSPFKVNKAQLCVPGSKWLYKELLRA